MTRDEELRLLHGSVAYVATVRSLDPDAQAALLTSVEGRIPVALLDQQNAAAADVYAAFPTLGRALLGEETVRADLDIPIDDPDKLRFISYLMAAVVRCLATRPCAHASVGATRLFALLGPRVLSCDACMLTFVEVLATHDAGSEHDTECDLCLVRGVTRFTPFTASYGPVLLRGDLCDDCAKLSAP